MATKATSFRLPEPLAAELAAVARADGMPISEAVRQAIEKHVAERRADDEFQERLKQLLEEEQKLLKRLAK
ncbi:MAG: ribbon-helix-helix protein, CopG family [Solirubrobacterales bacterium]